MSVHTQQRRNINLKSGTGFTLIEILIVMVIVGIIMAVAFLSFGILGDDRGLEKEARRLSSLIEVISEDAEIQGREFGLEFMLAGYRFVEHDPLVDQWFEVQGDDYMRQRDLDEGVEFELTIEDRKVLLHEEARATEKDEDNPQRDLTDDYLPHVLIFSSGDITPFELGFVRFADRSQVILEMTLAGELEIRNDAENAL
jgi:general secretion pathway protein H